MQLTIFITPEVENALRRLAGLECRSVNQEAKWLLCKAIEQATKEPQCAQASELQGVADALSHVE